MRYIPHKKQTTVYVLYIMIIRKNYGRLSYKLQHSIWIMPSGVIVAVFRPEVFTSYQARLVIILYVMEIKKAHLPRNQVLCTKSQLINHYTNAAVIIPERKL